MSHPLLKRCLVGGLTVIGLLLAFGPGEWAHHQLHHHTLLPFMQQCCCLDPLSGQCAWSDHFGHAWSAHGKIHRVGLGVTASGFLAGVAVYVMKRMRSRLDASSMIPCEACGYDLQGQLTEGWVYCPECGAAHLFTREPPA